MSEHICPYCGRNVALDEDGAFARDRDGGTYCQIAGDDRIFPLHGAVPRAARAG